MQTRLMDVGREAQTLSAALNHSALNLANAFGAWLGGAVIAAGYGWASTGWVGALLALAGLAVFGLSIAVDRRRRPVGRADSRRRRLGLVAPDSLIDCRGAPLGRRRSRSRFGAPKGNRTPVFAVKGR